MFIKKYQCLQGITNNFTRDSTRMNCAKVDKLYLCDERKRSDSLEEYFPYVIDTRRKELQIFILK
jgi:hypothetical protein